MGETLRAELWDVPRRTGSICGSRRGPRLRGRREADPTGFGRLRPSPVGLCANAMFGVDLRTRSLPPPSPVTEYAGMCGASRNDEGNQDVRTQVPGEPVMPIALCPGKGACSARSTARRPARTTLKELRTNKEQLREVEQRSQYVVRADLPVYSTTWCQ